MGNASGSLASAVDGADARAKALKLADAGDFEDDAILAWLGAHQLHRGRLNRLVIGDEPLPARASAKAIVIRTIGDAEAVLRPASKDTHAMGVLTKLARRPGSGLKPKASKAEVLASLGALLVTGELWAIRPARGGRRGGSPITADLIRMIMPHAGSQADVFVDALNAAMIEHGIVSDEQRAGFLAQMAIESGDLRNVVEDLERYSAPRILQIFRREFRTLDEAKAVVGDAEALGNKAYAHKNGNGDVASGDGYTFRGRGLMQITGRENYRKAGFENNPDALADPQTAADTAADYWERHKLNDTAKTVLDRKGFDKVTLAVNGTGMSQADDRWAAYQRALAAFGIAP